MWVITPVVIGGGIVLYVIERMKHTYNEGQLGKKNQKVLNNY